MASTPGQFLTSWTIRAALACFVAYVASEWMLPTLLSPQRRRLIWTLGCVLFDVHVASAFHFSYRWSHVAAWQHTAERTDEMLGVPFGGGIYFSYLFLMLWWLDVAWLWLQPASSSGDAAAAAVSHARPGDPTATVVPIAEKRNPLWPRWRIAVHLYLLFIAFQGAIVFEGGPTRWAGIAACVAIVSLVLGRAYNTATAAVP